MAGKRNSSARFHVHVEHARLRTVSGQGTLHTVGPRLRLRLLTGVLIIEVGEAGWMMMMARQALVTSSPIVINRISFCDVRTEADL
jgi:hypothetical protein